MSNLLQNPYFILFLVIGLGMALGAIRICGLSLGTSGVLFAALVAGHFGLQVPNGVRDVGLAIFVYCIGLGAGARFFVAIARQGSRLAFLSILIVCTGAGVIYICSRLLDIPAGLSAGIFAGACTSTPALASATEVLKDISGQNSALSIGYGIAYPFGVIGVVLFVQLAPKLLGYNLNTEAKKLQANSKEPTIISKVVRITNNNLFQQTIADNPFFDKFASQITRIVRDGQLCPLSTDDIFTPDTEVLMLGPSDKLKPEIALIGESVKNDYIRDIERQRRKILLLSKKIAGKSIRELKTVCNYGIVISRVSRLGFVFVPTADTVLERNDVLMVVGDPDKLEQFAKLAGHRPQAFDQTDLLSLCLGLALGIFIGSIEFGLAGSRISLGIAGGPLIVGLLLGHFGKIGPLIGYIPRPTRLLLQDMGLVFFLACAGIAGGGDLVKTVTKYGSSVIIMSIACSFIPIFVGYFFGKKLMRMNILEVLGGICGGMTSTPALGAISTQTDSQAPVVSYATAYPIALILMTVLTKMLIQAIGFAL
ncbi:MAG: aspartate:alanine exchanger family transporter [Akkermansia sp.]